MTSIWRQGRKAAKTDATSVANSNLPKICLSASENLQNLHLQKCALLLHFYVTIFSKMKIMLRNIFKKFSVEKIWNFYHTKSAKTCTICTKISHFLSKEEICRLGQKSLQIFVKISSARKIENLPFSEKSAELATLLILSIMLETTNWQPWGS